jgi:hypothetical protein
VRYDDKQNSQRRKRITLENEKRTEQTTYDKTISLIWKKTEKYQSFEHAKMNKNRLSTKKGKKKKKSTKRRTKK